MKKIQLFILFLFFIFSSCSQSQHSNSEYKLDLSKERKVSYTLNKIEKKLENLTSNLQNQKSDTACTFSKENLTLDIKDNLLNIIQTNIQTKSFTINSSSYIDTVEKKSPDKLIEGLNEYGEKDNDKNQSRTFIDLFPLPYRETSDKKEYTIKSHVFFGIVNSKLKIYGTRKISLLDTLRINNHNCVKVKCISTFDEVENHKSLDQVLNYDMNSTFWGYYDYELKIFIEGHCEINSKVFFYSKSTKPNEAPSWSNPSLNATIYQKYDYTIIE